MKPEQTAKHTPGPWHVFDNYKGGIPLSVGSHFSEHGSVTVARIDFNYVHHLLKDRPSQTCLANARLIAAAPELLEACKALLKYAKAISSSGDNVEKKNARAAIAKAEGRQP